MLDFFFCNVVTMYFRHFSVKGIHSLIVFFNGEPPYSYILQY